jgi:hypothetical protein
MALDAINYGIIGQSAEHAVELFQKPQHDPDVVKWRSAAIAAVTQLKHELKCVLEQ